MLLLPCLLLLIVVIGYSDLLFLLLFLILIYILSIYMYMGRCLKERLQKEDKGGHIILESIIFSLRYKAGPQGALLNPKGGARFAIDGR